MNSPYAQNGLSGLQSLGLAALMNQSGLSQWSGHSSLLHQQQANNALNSYCGPSGFHNISPSTVIGHDGDYWETRDQRRLKRAQDLAADARSRHPEMQVKRRTRPEDVCK